MKNKTIKYLFIGLRIFVCWFAWICWFLAIYYKDILYFFISFIPYMLLNFVNTSHFYKNDENK